MWLRLAIGVARRTEDDWHSYSEAFVNLGDVYRLWNQPTTSRRYYATGVRAARRHSYLQVRGAALHGLFLLSADRGDLDCAEHYARLAARAYGRAHPRLPELDVCHR